MRVSSETSFSGVSGTLKSTRMNVTRPRRSSSSMRAMVMAETSVGLLSDVRGEIDGAVRVAPLVVVPGDDLHQVALHDAGELGVERGAGGVADVIARDQRLVGDE